MTSTHSRAAAVPHDPDLQHAVETSALLSHQDDLDRQAFSPSDPRRRPPLADSTLHPPFIFQPTRLAARTQQSPGKPTGLHHQGLPQLQGRNQSKQLPEEPVEGNRVRRTKASAQPQFSAGGWSSGRGGRRRRRRNEDGSNGAWRLHEHK